MKQLIIAIAAAVAVTGCTDAQQAKIGGWGDPHHVILYSGGQQVADWETTGRVENEENSDGFYFNERETNALVRVSGDVVILLERDYQACIAKGDACQYK